MTDPNVLCLNVAHVFSDLCLASYTEEVRYADVPFHRSCFFESSGPQSLDISLYSNTDKTRQKSEGSGEHFVFRST
jgi:hypothetical protein